MIAAHVHDSLGLNTWPNWGLLTLNNCRDEIGHNFQYEALNVQ